MGSTFEGSTDVYGLLVAMFICVYLDHTDPTMALNMHRQTKADSPTKVVRHVFPKRHWWSRGPVSPDCACNRSPTSAGHKEWETWISYALRSSLPIPG